MRNVFISFSACALFAAQLSAFAAPAPPVAPSGSANQPVNLNLASTASSVAAAKSGVITVGGHLQNGVVVGGARVPVTLGDMLTPAMNAALWQTAQGGQHLLLNAGGAAIGGTEKIAPAWAGTLSSLVVPQGVIVDAIGFTNAHPLNVSGASQVLGQVFSFQRTAGLTTVLNFANDLSIAPGALLSSQVPQALVAQGFHSSDLTLSIAGTFTNAGTVSGNNINLISGSGIIVNSGTISAASGLNINTASPTTNLIIDNRQGVIASGGTMNIRTAGADIESANAGIWGGTISARDGINMFGKDMVAQVDRIDGMISNTGSEAHLSVKEGTLTLGNQLLTGDPTYFNNSGGIVIGSLTTVGGNLVIVASGDIQLANATTTISTVNPNDSIFMAAGVDFDNGGGSNFGIIGDNDPGDTTHGLSNFTPNATGGSINSGGLNLNLTTTGNGTITAIANNGSIKLGSGNISTVSGAILMIADGGITGSGSISSTSGTAKFFAASVSGLDTLSITQPNTVISGAPTAGTATSGAITLGPTSAQGGLTVSSGDANTAVSGGPVKVTSIASNNAGAVTLQGSTVEVDSAISATKGISITQLANATLELSATATPGPGNIAGTLTGTPIQLSSGGPILIDATLNANTITLTSGANGTNAIFETANGGLRGTTALGAANVTVNMNGDATATTDLTQGNNKVTTISASGLAGQSVAITNSVAATLNLGHFTDDMNLTATTIGNGGINTNYDTTFNNLTATCGEVFDFTIGNLIVHGNATLRSSGAVPGDPSSMILIDDGNTPGTASLVCSNTLTMSAENSIVINAPVTAASFQFTANGSANAIVENKSPGVDGVLSGPSGSAAPLQITLGDSAATVSLNASNNNISTLAVSAPSGATVSLTNKQDKSLTLTSLSNGLNITAKTSGLGGLTFGNDFNLGLVNFTSGTAIDLTKSITSNAASGISKLIATTGDVTIDGTNGGAFIGTAQKRIEATAGKVLIDGTVIGPSVTLFAGASGPNVILETANGVLKSTGVNATDLTVIMNGDNTSTTDLTAGQNSILILSAVGKALQTVSVQNIQNQFLALGALTNDMNVHVTLTGNGILVTTTDLVLNDFIASATTGIQITNNVVVHGTLNLQAPGQSPSDPNAIIEVEDHGAVGLASLVCSNPAIISAEGEILIDAPVSGPSFQFSSNASGNAVFINEPPSTNGSLTGIGGSATSVQITLGGGSAAVANLSGTVNVGALSGAGSGSITVANSVDKSIDLNGFGSTQNLSVTTTGAGVIGLNQNITAGSVTLITDQSFTLSKSITTTGALSTIQSTTSGVVIDGTNGGALIGSGPKLLSGATTVQVNGAVAGSAVTLSAGANGLSVMQSAAGSINGPAGADLTINLGGDQTSTADLSAGSNNVKSFAATGVPGTSLTLAGTGSALSLGTFGTGQVLNLSLPAGSAITTMSNLNLGAVTMSTDGFINSHSVSAASFSLNGVGSSLSVNNSGSITSNPGNISITAPAGSNLVISGGGHLSGQSITLTATTSGTTASAVSFTGSQTFDTAATINASGPAQLVTIGDNVSVVGSSTLTVNSSHLDVIGSGSIVGNPLIFNFVGAGTIAAPNATPKAPLDLKQVGNLVLQNGQSLAIISAADIVNTGPAKTIDLSSTTGTGGSLTLLAGFTFNGVESISGPSQGTYNNIVVNPAGGKINLTNVSIITSTSASNFAGGDVLAVANGSLALGPITTDAPSGVGGGVTLVGNGVTVGAISSAGSASHGVSITSAPGRTITGHPEIINGVFFNGQILPSAPFGGNISIKGITAPNANVSLATGGKGTISQGGGTTITASSISATTDSANISLNVKADTVSAHTITGNATFTDSVLAGVGDSTVGGLFTVKASAGITADNVTVTGTKGISFLTAPVKGVGGGIEVSNSTLNALNGTITLKDSVSNGIITVDSGSVLNSVTAVVSTVGGATIGPATFNATKTITLTSTAGLDFHGAVLNSGALSSATTPPTSPLPLSKDNIASAGAIKITASGTDGITGAADNQFVVAGGSVTMSAPKGVISFADRTKIEADGGSVTLTAGGDRVRIGFPSSTLANKSTITARLLGTTGGAIKLTGQNGVLLGGNAQTFAGGDLTINSTLRSKTTGGNVDLGPSSSTQAHGKVTITDSGSNAFLTFENQASLASGVTNSTAGTGGITLKSGNVIKADNGAVQITSPSTVSLTAPGDVRFGSGNLNAGSTATLTSTAGTVHLAGTAVQAKTLTATGFTQTLLDQSASVTTTGNMVLKATSATGTVQLDGGVQLAAGALISPPASGNIPLTAVQSAGSISLSGANVSVTNTNNQLTATSANLTLTAGKGNITIGDSNVFTANGGNVFVFAKGNVSGGTSNTFNARSVGDPAKASGAKGGGVEIGSGLTSSGNVVAALNGKLNQPNPSPSSLSSGGVINFNNSNGATGTIRAVISGTGSAINLTSGGTTATLNLPPAGNLGPSGGAQVFDAKGGTSVTFQGGAFNTAGLKPIALTEFDDFVVDTELDGAY